MVPDSVMVGLIASELKKLAPHLASLMASPGLQPRRRRCRQRHLSTLSSTSRSPSILSSTESRIGGSILDPDGVYNLLSTVLPKLLAKDDETGEDLIQRDDDKPRLPPEMAGGFQAMTNPCWTTQGPGDHRLKGTESKKIWPLVETHLKSAV